MKNKNPQRYKNGDTINILYIVFIMFHWRRSLMIFN